MPLFGGGMEIFMNKVFLFGASKTGEETWKEMGEYVEGFIDSYKAGTVFCGKPVLSLDTYIENRYTNDIVICSNKFVNIIHLLASKGITNFSLSSKLYISDDVPLSKEIAHGVWIEKLKELVDCSDKEVLEIGSRVVTGSNFRDNFVNANYTGFDLYAGENVDVVGDAHKLSMYFDKKFDLIFCSAVFEHFSMPWLVADEMISLCKEGGYIFVETHYSYSSHERPWHFFQYSENALKVLFSESRGIQCIEAGCSNPLIGCFSREANEYLRGKNVGGLYCHSEFLGRKVRDMDLDWRKAYEGLDIGVYPCPKV